jgi:hypothetical protein
VRRKGAPLDWFVIPPLISMPNNIAVATNAPLREKEKWQRLYTQVMSARK